MARLLADEKLPRPVVIDLRRRGHDVLDVEQAGLSGQGLPDVSVLELASADGRAIFTLDRGDYFRLHNVHGDHAGIIACTLDRDFVRMAARIDALVSTLEWLDGWYLRVVRPGPGTE